LSCLPDGRSQTQANDLFFFATPETSHEQDASIYASFAKWNRLIQRGHAEPARAFLFERSCTLDRAMPVRVGFYYGANRYGRTYVTLHGSKILTQGSQRDFCPGRPSRSSLGNFDGSH
jgi:hypothetical protein